MKSPVDSLPRRKKLLSEIIQSSTKKIAVLFLLSFVYITLPAQTLPAGFNLTTVAGSLNNPTVMAFAPDGRLFVCQQTGELRVIKNGVLLAQPFITLNVSSSGERGLVGIAFDPDFDNNQFVYLYYTLATGANNRISRFTANGDIAVPGSEVTVLDLDPLSSVMIHNGGTMVFAADGTLFVGVGENGNSANSQDLNTNLGKILRINKNGTIPAGNPFTTGNTEKQQIWSYGVRNPFTITRQQGTNKLFIDDVGQSTWEEINDGTTGGLNFGWPNAEGVSSNPAYANPVYTYMHGSGSGLGCAITGGTFYNGAIGNFPASYNGNYFFLDYCSNWIDKLSFSGSTVTRSTFASSLPGSGVGLITGPDGNLYFLGRDNGSVYKIIYTANATIPVIINQPQSVSAVIGDSVTFTVSAAGTKTIHISMEKNGVDIAGKTGATYKIGNVTAYKAGTYTVVVSNSAGSVVSNNAILSVSSSNNTSPVASILTPAANATYAGGDVISFSGSGTDAEDGTLPASAYKWVVEFHHDIHTHPGPTAGTGIKTGSFTIPANGETSSNVYYRLYLILTDSKGAVDTDHVDILPRKSSITINTSPPGLNITLDGQPFQSPLKFTGVQGITRTISVTSSQSNNGFTYTFQNWSNGGSATQTIVTPVNNTTYTATFSSSLRIPENPASTINGLNYNYYQGTWSTLPNFNALTVFSTDTINNFDISRAQQPDNFGFHFGGYISIPTDGIYTFYSSSDDGSRIYIGTDKIVNNDSLHGVQEVSGQVGLKAGKHAITVEYFEAAGGNALTVSYSGPGIIKQQIPNSVLYRIPSFASSIQLQSTGDAYVSAGTNSSNNYGADLYLYTRKTASNITATNESYIQFDLTTAPSHISNAKLRLWGNTVSTTVGSVKVNVKATATQSWDEFLINFNNKPSAQVPVLDTAIITSTAKYNEWNLTSYIQSAKNLGIATVTFRISNDQYFPDSRVKFNSRQSSLNFPILQITSSTNAREEILPNIGISCKIYPNPSSSLLNIDIENADPAAVIKIFLYSIDGKMIRELNINNIHSTMNVNDIANGTYFICVKQNNEVSWNKLMVNH